MASFYSMAVKTVPPSISAPPMTAEMMNSMEETGAGLMAEPALGVLVAEPAAVLVRVLKTVDMAEPPDETTETAEVMVLAAPAAAVEPWLMRDERPLVSVPMAPVA